MKTTFERSCRRGVLDPSIVAADQRHSRRRSQDFLWGCTFLDQKSNDLFLVITLSYTVITTSTFLSHLRWCTSPNSAPFLPHFDKILQKCLEIFLIALHGGAPAPPELPGYAYGHSTYIIQQYTDIAELVHYIS